MDAIINAWDGERKSGNITKLPTQFDQYYQTERNKLQEQLNAPEGSIERRVAEKALQRLDFCWQDIFHLRKKKLLDAVFRETELKVQGLLPWEQQYYADIQKLEFFYKQNINDTHKIISPPSNSLQQIPPVPISPTGQEKGVSPQIEFPSIPVETVKTQIPTVVQTPNDQQISHIQTQELNYITIRFLRAECAIMGVDMREYGPFESGEIAYLPDIHARIFILNGIAHEVHPSN